jgi:hypothetical protein
MAQIKGAPSISAAVSSLTRSTTQLAPLGQIVPTEDGEYMYIKAAGAITVSGDGVQASGLLQSTGGGVRSASTTAGFLGVAEAPFASGEYGYIKRKGFVDAMVASGTTANGILQTTTTSGVLGNITTSGTGIGIALEANTGAAAKKKVFLFG